MSGDPLADLTDEEFAKVVERAATSGLPVRVYVELMEGRWLLAALAFRRLGREIVDALGVPRLVDWLNRKVGGR